jgi:hypothetical protein
MTILKWFGIGLCYVILSQVVSFLFSVGVGLYWIVWYFTGRTEIGGRTDGTLFGFPFVMSENGIVVNICTALCSICAVVCLGNRFKEEVILWIGIATMILATVGDYVSKPMWTPVVSDVLLWTLVLVTIYGRRMKRLTSIRISLNLYCLSLVFFVGLTTMKCLGSVGIGVTNWYYWIVAFIICSFGSVMTNISPQEDVSNGNRDQRE